MGISGTIILALLLNRIRKEGIKKKIQLLIMHLTLFQLSYFVVWFVCFYHQLDQ